ncbi:hypothetical protein HY491_04610 [Candidatus Woesearchaeota archaeon]|nr:hypothetical protein [Candidatus Woesearchaeota archaeon]
MYSITQFGKPLDPGKYVIDRGAKTFSSKESDLVLDFSGENGWTFNVRHRCAFITGNHCTFETGHDCLFETASDCVFRTGYDCVFRTGAYCTFNTGHRCTFRTGSDCVFRTGSGCVFHTYSDCTFKAGEQSVCIRRDTFESIPLPPGRLIRLHEHQVPGWEEAPEEVTTA